MVFFFICATLPLKLGVNLLEFLCVLELAFAKFVELNPIECL